MVKNSAILLLAAVVSCPAAAAQTTLTCEGQSITYVGKQVQDFLIPSVADDTPIDITVYGANGGNRTAGDDNECTEAIEGQGAAAWGRFFIGTNGGQLQPGGKLRFIIGEAGAGHWSERNWGGAAGGGGGSGVFYLAPSSTTWVTLVVAGGGGGAGRGLTNCSGAGNRNCTCPLNGLGANAGTQGRDGGTGGYAGGTNGLGGVGSTVTQAEETFDACGGGGGLFGSGTGSGIGGGAAFVNDVPVGGAGGKASDTGRAGGWGAGGGGGAGAYSDVYVPDGGGAGGGGGYSGGGGGNAGKNRPGGGGGSYVNYTYAVAGDIAIGNPAQHGSGFVYIDTEIANDTPAGAIALSDGVTVNGPFLCGATTQPFDVCGTPVSGPDLWYRYTNQTACSLDITVQLTSGTGNVYGYAGAPFDPNTCRGLSIGGVFTDTLASGETVVLRVVDITSATFQIQASSAMTAGPDCDNDGIPDACDPVDTCPPPNDTCATAIALSPGTYPYDMNFGTLSTTAPCAGIEFTDTWYSFTAPASGQLGIIDQAEPLQGDRSIAVYDTCGGTLMTCTSSYNSRPNLPNNWTAAYVPLAAGQTVLIRLADTVGIGGDFARGNLTLTFDESFTNDQCPSAIALSTEIGRTLSVPFDLSLAEDSGDIPGNCLAFDRLDAWFQYTAPTSGLVIITTEGTIFDSNLSLYDACGGNEIACNENKGGEPYAWWAQIDQAVAAGETIWIRVSGYNWEPAAGLGLLNITPQLDRAPEIDAITPPRGPRIGGNTITIRGIGFTPTSTVSFDGVPGSVTFVDYTELQVVVPGHAVSATREPGLNLGRAATSVDVVVTNAFGADTEEDGYTYLGKY